MFVQDDGNSRQLTSTAHSPPASSVGDTASFGLGLSQDSRQTTGSNHSPLTSPVKGHVSSWLLSCICNVV